MSDDTRSVLEGIAYGDDPRIAPGDRLRAVERLLELDPSPTTMSALEREVQGWDQATLDREVDDLCGEEMARDLLSDAPRMPNMARVIREEIEQRARELADRDAIDAEVERLVAAKARWLLEREIGASPPAAPYESTHDRQPETPSTTPEAVTSRPASIPYPPGVEPDAGFVRRRSRVRRLGND